MASGSRRGAVLQEHSTAGPEPHQQPQVMCCQGLYNHPIEIRENMGLDEAAIAAVSQWKFKPGSKDGAPVAVIAQIEVTLRLLL